VAVAVVLIIVVVLLMAQVVLAVVVQQVIRAHLAQQTQAAVAVLAVTAQRLKQVATADQAS